MTDGSSDHGRADLPGFSISDITYPIPAWDRQARPVPRQLSRYDGVLKPPKTTRRQYRRDGLRYASDLSRGSPRRSRPQPNLRRAFRLTNNLLGNTVEPRNGAIRGISGG